MLGAIPILALSCGAATSQTPSSPVLNNQVQLGDVFAEQTLDVITADESTAAITTSIGNAMTAGSIGRNMAVQSYQELQGAVQAHTVVDVAANMGVTGSVTTTATGNTADTLISGATATAVKTQVTGPTSVYALGQIEAANATVGDMSHATQAIANSQGFSLMNSAMGARVSQWNESNVLADGGAIVGESTGQATVTANAAANNLNSVGANESAQRIIATQGNTGDSVQASKFTAYGQSYTSTTNATAAANNINLSNQGALLDATTNQSNTAYVRAQSEGTAAVFSAQTVSAFGAGNSTLAGNMGPELVLDNTQFNGGGGVEVIAVADGTYGWDNSASASAVGNAVTGYACSSCTSRMTVSNNQTNDTDVSARTTTRMGNGRSVTGVASAVGNTASFYTASPSE
ncbi:MAG: hypothetical protein BGN86_02425 [Caulobacterales bacterium 68-7]|nr:MAG: hypothetical protein BGN86_02425 [Caulobacterales bacterium 68-7]